MKENNEEIKIYYNVNLDEEHYYKFGERGSFSKTPEGMIRVESFPQIEDTQLWPAYKLVNNEWILDENKLLAIQEKISKQERIEQINLEMEEIQAKLNNTDYKTLKWMEGLLTDEEYNPTKEERISLRSRYNELEEEIRKIKEGGSN